MILKLLNLNTSNVKVKDLSEKEKGSRQLYLNTSNVKVKVKQTKGFIKNKKIQCSL